MASPEDLQQKTPSVVADTLLPDLDDAARVRECLSAAIKKSGKSRDQIADEMTMLIRAKVTARALDFYTAESQLQNRFPLEYARAFCKATGDDTLLRLIPNLAGMRIIGPEDQALLDLGREVLRQKRAAAAIANLEAKLSGVQLG